MAAGDEGGRMEGVNGGDGGLGDGGQSICVKFDTPLFSYKFQAGFQGLEGGNGGKNFVLRQIQDFTDNDCGPDIELAVGAQELTGDRLVGNRNNDFFRPGGDIDGGD